MQGKEAIGASAISIFSKFKAENTSNLSLKAHAKTNPSQWLSDFKPTLKSLDPSIRSLDLSDNDLSSCSLNEIIHFLDGLPANITKVDLQYNGLFENKSPKEIDDVLLALEKTNFKGELNLENNGEFSLSRAICPLISKARQGFGFDLAYEILSYLLPRPIKATPSQFFKTKLNSLVPCQTLEQYYDSFGGSCYKTLKLAGTTENMKLDTLKEWAKDNPEGAAAKVLSRLVGF